MSATGHKRGPEDDIDDIEKEVKKVKVDSQRDIFHVAPYQDSDPDSNTGPDSMSVTEEEVEEKADSTTGADSTSDTEEVVVEEEEEEAPSTATLLEPEVVVDTKAITMLELDRCKLELKAEQAKVLDLNEKLVQQSIIKKVMKYQITSYTSKFLD